MAHLRLIVLVVAACNAAGAQPDPATKEVLSGIAPPAGWQSLPAIAAAARLAVDTAGGATIAGAESWGEPATGCYALWLSLRGTGGTADELGTQIVEGLAAEQITTADVQPITGDILALAFEAPAKRYRGKLRAKLGDGRVTALACFANQREPAACEPACTALLGGVR